jgi:quercetin dioxygenase-like cupin family protein
VKEETFMDTNAIKDKIVTNVYYISPEKKVPMHKHEEHDEVFYCIQGKGYGVLECEDKELTLGKEFIVPAGTLHSLKSDSDLFVTSFLIPVIREEIEKPKQEKKEDKEEKQNCKSDKGQEEKEDKEQEDKEDKKKSKDKKDRDSLDGSRL